MSAEYCPDCGGDPRRPENLEPHKQHECPTCEGAGMVASNFGLSAAPGTQPDIEPCPDCHGSGSAPP